MGSGSRAGLGSRTVALRFRVGAEGRPGGAAAADVAVAEVPAGGSEELAACRAEDRVILEDMSIGSSRLTSSIHSTIDNWLIGSREQLRRM